MSQICCNITLNSLQCSSNGPMHTASIFHCEFTDVMILLLYYPFNHDFCTILCCNWLKPLYVSRYYFSTTLPLAGDSPNLGVSHYLEVIRADGQLTSHAGLMPSICPPYVFASPNFSPWYGGASQ